MKKTWFQKIVSVLLTAVLLFSAAGQAAYAESVIDISGDDTSIYEDLWAQVLENGEDIITFPSRVTEELAPGEVSYFGFYLEEQTDLNILLDADFPCYLLLCKKDQPVNVQTLPFGTQKIEERRIPAGYYQIYILPQEEYENERISFSLQLGSFSEKDTMPDLAEFDLAGKLYNKMSPFHIEEGSDYPVFIVESDQDAAPNRKADNSKDLGGDSYKACSYFLNWLGPVPEDVMPQVEEAQKATPSNYMQYVPETPSFHVQEAICLPGAKNASEIGTGDYVKHWKNALMTYGAVELGMCVNRVFWAQSPKGEENNKYYYCPQEFRKDYATMFDLYANHDVTLVGWDDTVPKERFRVNFFYTTSDGVKHEADYTPEGDGAWIIRNSWGGDYHAGGDFYLSYYDSFVGQDWDHMAYGQIESYRNYNHIYANDLTISRYAGGSCAAELFEGKKKGMASESFTNDTDTDELLRAVSFGSPYSGYRYTIYADVEESDDILQLKQGYINYAGIHTVRLDQGLMIPAGSVFTIYVALELPVNAEHNVGMFYATEFGDDANTKKITGDTALYYPKGDADFQTVSSGAKEGEYPVIHALCYADASNFDEGPSFVSIPDFYDIDKDPETVRLTIQQTLNAEIVYEDGVTLDALEDGSIFSQYQIVDKRKGNSQTGKDAQKDQTAVAESATEEDTAAEGSAAEGTAAISKAEESTDAKDTAAESTTTESVAGASQTAQTTQEVNKDKISTPSNFPDKKNAGASDKEDSPYAIYLEGEKILNAAHRRDPAKDIEDTEQYHTGLEHDQSTKQVDYRDYNGGVMNVDLPESYNLVSLNQVTPVRDQGNSGQCWAFGAIKAVESAMMKNYQRLTTYPRGIEVSAENGDNIINGLIDITIKPEEARSLVLKALLNADDGSNLDNDMIVWSYEGDLNCISDMIESSDNGQAVSVLKTAGGSGVILVTASSRSDPQLSVTISVRITEDVPTEVTLSETELHLQPGASAQLIAEVISSSDVKVVWTSDNPNVATVDQNGKVYAVRPGVAVITAKAGNAEARCTVYVGGVYDTRSSSSKERTSSHYGITEGGWEQSEDGSWSFTEKITGRKAVGWRYIKTSDGQFHWFMFGPDTKMLTGWFRDTDGRWYYLASAGDETELSRIGQTGAMVSGWFKDPSDGHSYYLSPDSGAMVTGERIMNGKKYFFNEMPAGTTGWYYDETSRRWHYEGGIAVPMGALLKEE